MAEFTEIVHEKCVAFADRIVKLNDYLLVQTAKNEEVRARGTKDSERRGKIPVYLLSVATLCNQLLRAGTSIGANNAEAMNAISKSDYRSKSFIALKEARESLYWINLLHRNGYLEDVQFQSIYADCEELVRILMTRCKKLNEG